MKKLQFNDVKAKELLDIKQMRHVRGGASGTCGVLIPAAYITTEKVEVGKNGYVHISISTEFISGPKCNIDKAEAKYLFDNYKGTSWCCDQCPQTSYCGS